MADATIRLQARSEIRSAFARGMTRAADIAFYVARATKIDIQTVTNELTDITDIDYGKTGTQPNGDYETHLMLAR